MRFNKVVDIFNFVIKHQHLINNNDYNNKNDSNNNNNGDNNNINYKML